MSLKKMNNLGKKDSSRSYKMNQSKAKEHQKYIDLLLKGYKDETNQQTTKNSTTQKPNNQSKRVC